MQTSGGKFQWFCHQLSIEQALLFPSLSPYMAQNYTRITTVLLLLPTCSLFQSILNSYHFLLHVCRVSFNFTSCLNSDTTASTDILFYIIHITIQLFEMMLSCMTLLHFMTQYCLKSSYRNFHLVKKCRLYFFYLTKLFPITYCTLLTVINFIMVAGFQINYYTIQMEL